MRVILTILIITFVYWAISIKYTAKDNSVYIKGNFKVRFTEEQ